MLQEACFRTRFCVAKKRGEMMLLKDEQYVLKWLSQYGALTRTQITRN